MIYVGMDPGKKGGVVAIDDDGNIVESFPFPMIGTEYDTVKMARMVSNLTNLGDCFFCIEDVKTVAVGSKKSCFSFGEGKGILRGIISTILVLIGCKYELVKPQAWQKAIHTPSDCIYKPRTPKQKNPSLDPKKTSLMAAKRLFPGESFIAKGCSTIHDGLIDAALIAEYLRRRVK
jgi:hypothetical protein